jgi:hypothetical protein
MPRMTASLVRSGLFLTGLLLLAVGFGNMIAGQSKIAQYDEVLSVTAAPPEAHPPALFPSASEGEERQQIVRAKLAFYQLLVTAGQLLSALGVSLVGVGILRVWMRAARAAADVHVSN